MAYSVAQMVEYEAQFGVNMTLDGSTYPGWKIGWSASESFIMSTENAPGYCPGLAATSAADGPPLDFDFEMPRDRIPPEGLFLPPLLLLLQHFPSFCPRLCILKRHCFSQLSSAKVSFNLYLTVLYLTQNSLNRLVLIFSPLLYTWEEKQQ